MDTYLLAMQDAEQFLTFLHSLSDMGAAMRRVMAKALISEENYATLTALHTGKVSALKSGILLALEKRGDVFLSFLIFLRKS